MSIKSLQFVLPLFGSLIAVGSFVDDLAAAPISASGWNVDFILGSGETHAAHQKPENNNIWFAEDSTVGTLGLPASGAVTAAGVNYQLQPYTGGTNNVLRSTAATNTLTLDSPAMFTELSILGSNTGASSALDWDFVLNFSDGPSSSTISYDNFTNWAGGTSDVLPNPQLTSNGSNNAFVGTLTSRTFDLDALGYSGFTLESIDFSNANGAGNNLAVFGLSGVEVATNTVPEPSSIVLWSLVGLGLGGFGYYRTRRKKQ